ncbi:MAG: efflux RND transporter permease subunit [Bacteroidia bacterium]|nr:efflux RND transporter permease subunit [Bacteroidia bacterium]
MSITELSIKRSSLVVIVFVALGLIGWFSYNRLKYELLPDITPPVISVTTIYPGASPSEVESSVTKPIEEAVSGVDEISTVNCTSQEGVSFVIIEFNQNADIDEALQNVQRKVNAVQPTFPLTVKSPVISNFALNELPVLQIGITSNLEARAFYKLLNDKVKPRIAKIPGVAQVTIVGGEDREIKVNLDSDRLRAFNIPIVQVMQIIRASNLDFPTGNIKSETDQFTVRIAGKIASLNALRNLVVGKTKTGGDIFLKDIAEIQDGGTEYKQISRINGKSSVIIYVQKQNDANAVEVSKLARKEIDKITADYQSIGINFDIAQDSSLYTMSSANAVKVDLMFATILVALVMMLFLHSLRNSLIVMVAIPSSLLSTFIIMYFLGFSLNLMTLLALSLVVGILVDDSIVVLENIHRHLEMKKHPWVAALRGRNEIGFTAMSITLVDVVVFLPLALVEGMIGNIMREFSLVVVFSTLMSLFVSFTITPMLASRFSRLEHPNPKSLLGSISIGFENYFERLKAKYNKLLIFSLKRGWLIALISTILFFASFALVPLGFIGAEFIPKDDKGEFSVSLELPAGSSLINTNKVTQQVESLITNIPEVKKVYTNVGVSNDGFIGQNSNNIAEVIVTLVPKEERKRATYEIYMELKTKILDIPGIKVRVNPIGIFGGADQTPIQIIVNGNSREDVKKSADIIADIVQKIPGTTDVRLSSEDGKPETQIDIDREKMANFGLSIAEIGTALQIALTGDDQSKFREGNDDYTIRVQLDGYDRSKIQTLGNITFRNPLGQLVELKQFANIYISNGPTKLQRFNRNSSIIVLSQVMGRASGDIGKDLKTQIAKTKFPEGTNINYWGDLKNQEESFGSMGIALMASIIFVYMIMVALYDSYVYPFVVLFSIPLAVIGALLALALAMKTLNIFSLLGMIMLVGLVAKNAILLVDFTNQLRQQGLSRYEALLAAGQERLRPILMTTISMIIGMLPIALSTSAGSGTKSPLAWALIGGLTSSLLLTLVLVPVVYNWIDGIKERFNKLLGIKEEPAPEDFGKADA